MHLSVLQILIFLCIYHGGLSQWDRSNRPRIRPLSFASLGRATYCTKYGQESATIVSGQYTLLSGRPVQTGQVLFEFKFTTAQSVIV